MFYLVLLIDIARKINKDNLKVYYYVLCISLSLHASNIVLF